LRAYKNVNKHSLRAYTNENKHSLTNIKQTFLDKHDLRAVRDAASKKEKKKKKKACKNVKDEKRT
jgi:hypothetical protein